MDPNEPRPRQPKAEHDVRNNFQIEAQVDVQIDDAFADRVSAELLREAASATLHQQGVTGPATLSVVITGDGTVRRLNRTFRGIDATTDVLAFGNADETSFVDGPDLPRYLGDVVISFSRAEAQARDAGHSLEAELQLLAVHGVLHLLGHDHADPGPKAAMWSAQGEILRDLGPDADNA